MRKRNNEKENATQVNNKTPNIPNKKVCLAYFRDKKNHTNFCNIVTNDQVRTKCDVFRWRRRRRRRRRTMILRRGETGKRYLT